MNLIKNAFGACILFLFLATFSLTAQEFLEMPKPTHTVKGIPTSTLELVKEIKMDFDEDLFFAVLWNVEVSKSGWIYAYDAKLFRIFIFDEKYRYVGQFLDQGEGPGEVNSSFALTIKMHPARNGNLYVSDSLSDRLIQFSPTGKFIDQKRMYRRGNAIPTFTPIFDKNGFLYAYSVNNGIVDMLDPEMKCVHTFLDLKENEKFVIFKPSLKVYTDSPLTAEFWKRPTDGSCFYGLTPDDRLIIYLYRSSTAYVFNGKKLERKFDILIDHVLPIFKKSAEDTIKKDKERKINIDRMMQMIHSCFVDNDEPYFYLNFLEGRGCGYSIFKFDLKGNLVRIIKSDKACINTKINGLFYGISIASAERNPVIMKEK